MTWVRLADDFYRHPKVLGAGPLAGWLWVCGLGYANHYLTDGYLPRAAVRGLTDLDEPFRLAAQLVDAQLWDAAEGGYRIHDYEQYQPSADTVKAERAANAERVAAWRERQRNDRSNGVRPDVRNGVSPGSPVPGPGTVSVNPVPAVSSSPLPPPPQAEEGEEMTVTTDDVVLWRLALDHLPQMTAGNRQQVHQLEPLGRAPDGGLRLRAPPGHRLARFRPQIARALADAGDAHGTQVQIVER